MTFVVKSPAFSRHSGRDDQPAPQNFPRFQNPFVLMSEVCGILSTSATKRFATARPRIHLGMLVSLGV